MNCIKCGKELINSAVCACDKIKLEEKLMGKKYRVKKDFWVFKKDVTMDFIFPISWVVEKLIKDGYIEEVKEDTLGNVIYDLGLNFNRQQIFKQYIIKQKIELLKEVGTGDSNKCFNRIINKISELEKEIK